MNKPQSLARWLNWAGDTFTSKEVVDFLGRAEGAGYTVEVLERTFPVGSIYENGGIWFQRACDESEVRDDYTKGAVS